MLDAWFKSKFYAKCKSTIRLTNARIEMVKRKRNAMVKFLKNDILDLIKTGLDLNAYTRAEGLLNEFNLSRCYDLLEQCCGHILNNLGTMYKQRECHEECREAVSTLIFAAARFADVPELRQLRSLFTDRYGNSLECYVSKEFLQNLKFVPPTNEMKIQLMQEIASESGIEWNSKALEQKLYAQQMSGQDLPKAQNDNNHKLHEKVDGAKFNHKNARQIAVAKGKSEHKGRKIVPDEEDSLAMAREDSDLSIRFDNSPVIKDIEVDIPDIEEQQSKPESDDKKPFHYKSIPPPYTRSRMNTKQSISDSTPTSSTGEGNALKEEETCKDDIVEKTKPKPKSARRRRSLPQQDLVDSFNGIDKGKDAIEDDEEKMMDQLLMHYSNKKFKNAKKKPEPAETSDVSRRRNLGNRATSLPVELEQTSPRELSKGHIRANSFQPNSNRHVHPKLPDYDDFVARMASLKAKSKE